MFNIKTMKAETKGERHGSKKTGKKSCEKAGEEECEKG